MKVLVCEEPGKFNYVTRDEPALQEGRAILKVKRIGICGTDLHAFEGTQPYFEYPRVLGHELACEIVDINTHADFKIGNEVTFIPYFNCGECIACRNGLTNCCVSMKVCGVHVDGGMAEYISVPVETLLHTKGLTVDEVALTEPLSIGAHAVRRGGVRPGEFVLVVGAGPIGLGIIEFAKVSGAQVIVMDTNEARLDFCKENMKPAAVLNPLTENSMQRLKEITNNDMPSVIFDATGNLKAINTAFQYMAHGGRYVLVGLQKNEISFSHPEFHKREATLMSSRNATREDFDHVIACIKSKRVHPSVYITHRVAFDEVKDQFASWLDPKNGVIKAMVQLN
jgi:2-desacetyl-2-hydroxyethyl bacteriochlorophyllide A dehydrogenase